MEQQTVGPYEVAELLGSGTVGAAYRVRHSETGQEAVVKLLQPEAATEPEIQRRFVREVSIAEKLNHPNIVRHYECGVHNDQIYFAMELVDSGTLKEVLLTSGALPWREAAECAAQICAALEHASQFGIIHRDLKPANLFLSKDGHVKVGDFGLARDLNSSRLTVDGQTVGTCRYMPPEQITGEDDLTGAVDLYAVGCILYEMVAGSPPFDGNTIVAIFEQHLYGEPTKLTQVASDCPPDLEKLVEMLLAKDPKDRPANAAVVRAALLDILNDRPMRLEARPTEELEADMVAASDHEQPNLTERLRSSSAGGQAKVASKKAMIAIGVVLVALVALYYVLS